MEIPRIPPEPGARVYLASDSVLRRVFGKGSPSRIEIGRLLTRPDVPVFVDVNAIVNRHLAILAITGAGKSNTVSVILEGILKLRGAVLVFDMHGEYCDFDLKVDGESVVNRIDTKLNPTRLSYLEFKLFAKVDDNAYVQDRYLRMALEEALKTKFDPSCLEPEDPEVKEDERFWDQLIATLELWANSEEYREDRKSIVAVSNKVRDMRENYSALFDTLAEPIVERVKPGKLNVIDLSQVDEKIADIIVSHVLRNLLEERKKDVRGQGSKVNYPLLTVIEEAHILASSTVNTRSRYWISRVAREGRKFGLGLCLVTQRPKALDSNALSQANNMIILRLVEPGDQRHVQQASEALSSDLVEQLPSLNVGEALVMGQMIPVPALVKIKKASAKRKGGDIDVVSAWSKVLEEKRSVLEDLKQLEDF
jgi:DNA helicase HerA-like ATPase